MHIIRKVVLPCAGLGTRLMPLTLSTPKEMLLLNDKPLIAYAIEEALHAGAEELIFVINDNKLTLIDYIKLLEASGNIKSKITFVKQNDPRGLGDAILSVQSNIDDETFAIILPDEIFFTDEYKNTHLLKQMLQLYFNTDYIKPHIDNLVATFPVNKSDVNKYGIIEQSESNKIVSMREKPHVHEVRSEMPLSILGRYILSSKIFWYLNNLGAKFENKKEIELTAAMHAMMESSIDGDFFAFLCLGHRMDCGSLEGIKAANTFVFR